MDYCRALKGSNHKVTAVIHPDALVKAELLKLEISVIGVKNFGQWDVFAKSYLKKILKHTNPDAVIVHGNRAVHLIKGPASGLKIPVIGVTHNYNIKYLIGLEAIFATTEQLRQAVIKAGQPERKVVLMPNMVPVEVRALKPQPFHQPFVVGAMGRFVKKKGFDVFIEAIAILNSKGVRVRGILGGGGEEENALKKLAKKRGVEFKITFPGWIQDKQKFFDDIDIFCLPSYHEPFGIILLEAFSHAKPVITTDSEGPSEIVTHNDNAIVVPKGDAAAIAKAVESLMANQAMTHQLAHQGYFTAQNYSVEAVGKKMSKALQRIVPLPLG